MPQGTPLLQHYPTPYTSHSHYTPSHYHHNLHATVSHLHIRDVLNQVPCLAAPVSRASDDNFAIFLLRVGDLDSSRRLLLDFFELLTLDHRKTTGKHGLYEWGRNCLLNRKLYCGCWDFKTCHVKEYSLTLLTQKEFQLWVCIQSQKSLSIWCSWLLVSRGVVNGCGQWVWSMGVCGQGVWSMGVVKRGCAPRNNTWWSTLCVSGVRMWGIDFA